MGSAMCKENNEYRWEQQFGIFINKGGNISVSWHRVGIELKIKILWNSSSGRSKVLATQQKRLQVVTILINSYSVGILHILAPSDFAIASIIITSYYLHYISPSQHHFASSSHFFLIKFLRLKSTNYKFSDSGAASHLVLPVLLLVMSSLSFRLV